MDEDTLRSLWQTTFGDEGDPGATFKASDPNASVPTPFALPDFSVNEPTVEDTDATTVGVFSAPADEAEVPTLVTGSSGGDAMAPTRMSDAAGVWEGIPTGQGARRDSRTRETRGDSCTGEMDERSRAGARPHWHWAA